MLKVYSVYDRKMQEFGQLAVSRNDETMRRAVLDGVKGSGSMIEKYPDDYALYRVGEFHSDTGFLAGLTSPAVLVSEVGELLRAGQQLKVVNDANDR